ncbi:hypothetical protein BJF80_06980 [Serinicoccus sp. CUA-874]|uniref:hypothetical protein n=1 Tax=Serinicoccus sp. CUA-874 TaxID=1517939 RepID=UPI0009648641|nr:hypothetical protein [Serinicoccus sp. CUA-874]OLT16318.1 hypothetical protein BJF80_06980 [Serinicoccus sp. CUA-874]OLT29851.1 hypothetical protein BJF82_15950 [Kytococcus sp. CUA-901]
MSTSDWRGRTRAARLSGCLLVLLSLLPVLPSLITRQGDLGGLLAVGLGALISILIAIQRISSGGRFAYFGWITLAGVAALGTWLAPTDWAWMVAVYLALWIVSYVVAVETRRRDLTRS